MTGTTKNSPQAFACASVQPLISDGPVPASASQLSRPDRQHHHRTDHPQAVAAQAPGGARPCARPPGGLPRPKITHGQAGAEAEPLS